MKIFEGDRAPSTSKLGELDSPERMLASHEVKRAMQSTDIEFNAQSEG